VLSADPTTDSRRRDGGTHPRTTGSGRALRDRGIDLDGRFDSDPVVVTRIGT
jgi:hypothetical protein